MFSLLMKIECLFFFFQKRKACNKKELYSYGIRQEKKTNKQIADIKKVIKSVFMLTFICYMAELCVTLRIDKKYRTF